MKRTSGEYAILLRLLDQALDLPECEREAWIEQLTGDALALRPALRRLLSEHASGTGADDIPARIEALARDAAAQGGAPALEPGRVIGHYRLLRELGRGGMGSVWLAERADGVFERRVALKLPHLTWSSRLDERMVRERSILAALDHPGIARLYEGGVTTDGRPYMAMEYVEGVDLLSYCEARRAALAERLRLFVDICAAVSYAQAHLVVHRDLKPANIFVTPGGQVKLLDFGIAKLLEPNVVGDVSRTAHLSPAYAAPEQLSGQTITTATDVYALGVILFQLLSGRLPWLIAELPLAAAVRSLEQAPPRLSAAIAAGASLTAAQARGDLEAIVAKALRADPAARYPDARILSEDIGRYQRHEPVLARSGARAYVLRRFVRRQWLPLSAAAAVFVALAAGITVALWQAHRADAAASRATATKDFLVSLFRASDPRIAQDTPRTDVTAKQLLDLGAARIEKDFSNQPEVQVELLGLTADIYNHLNDSARFAAAEQRWLERATAYYGPAHPIVLRGRLGEADAACSTEHFAEAKRILDETDGLIRSSGQDRSFLRALWWRERARVYRAERDGREEQSRSLQEALRLFAIYGPDTTEYALALDQAAADAADRGEALQAKQWNEQALAIQEKAPFHDDANIAITMNNLARKNERLGLFDAAESMYARAEAKELGAWDKSDITYWYTRAYHARFWHRRGQRDRADQMFAQIIEGMPKDWKKNSYDTHVREVYAECLVAEGRAMEAIPILESAYRAYLSSHTEAFSMREVRRRLGEAYDRAGRADLARVELRAARDEFVASEPASQFALKSRERWGRFLLDHSQPGDSDFDAAEAEFRDVLSQVGQRPWIESALAHAGLARIAIARADAATALAESKVALDSLERVQGLYEIRAQPQIWLVHSAALLLGGDAAAARAVAEKAAAASRSYDVASADTIRAADAAVRAASPRDTGNAVNVGQAGKLPAKPI